MDAYPDSAFAAVPLLASESLTHALAYTGDCDIGSDSQPHSWGFHSATTFFNKYEGWEYPLSDPMEPPVATWYSSQDTTPPSAKASESAKSCNDLSKPRIDTEPQLLGFAAHSLCSSSFSFNEEARTTTKAGVARPSARPRLDEAGAVKFHPHFTDSNVQISGRGGAMLPTRCPHPSCTSEVLFTRQCDLTKHYRQHERKHLCRIPTGDGCLIGFATPKDRNRHESSHAPPSIVCNHCGRFFSRQDNLRDHRRKRHS
ncbi:hypothetical protein NLG97_g2020 [Lecanicillium saksenae]|uniref:Uncharacterized protein n=1 Tax=Lecanicillium saksenae TaxID=468837 RepID=A0ACC1R3C8_9HYPO|nr:hypothetical protein NLG97_g2020 [Lecanicillium saksenae]